MDFIGAKIFEAFIFNRFPPKLRKNNLTPAKYCEDSILKKWMHL